MRAAQPSILISDDDRGIRETLRDLFVPRGFRTFLAKDGEEGLYILRREAVHVVVTDLEMPKLTGLELIRRARELDTDVPFILVSASEALRQAPHEGIFSVVPKPFSRQEICGVVDRALAAYR